MYPLDAEQRVGASAYHERGEQGDFGPVQDWMPPVDEPTRTVMFCGEVAAAGTDRRVREHAVAGRGGGHEHGVEGDAVRGAVGVTGAFDDQSEVERVGGGVDVGDQPDAAAVAAANDGNVTPTVLEAVMSRFTVAVACPVRVPAPLVAVPALT